MNYRQKRKLEAANRAAAAKAAEAKAVEPEQTFPAEVVAAAAEVVEETVSEVLEDLTRQSEAQPERTEAELSALDLEVEKEPQLFANPPLFTEPVEPPDPEGDGA